MRITTGPVIEMGDGFPIPMRGNEIGATQYAAIPDEVSNPHEG